MNSRPTPIEQESINQMTQVGQCHLIGNVIMSHMYSGIQISALKVNENKYVGSASLDELRTAGLRQPDLLDNMQSTSKEAMLAEAYELRNQVQRRFNKPRKDRGLLYKSYLLRSHAGDIFGDSPPVNIWVPNADSSTLYDEDNTVIYLPHNRPLIVIDGETQMYARFLWEKEKPESSTYPIAVVFHVGITAEAAGQRLHDYNHYAKPITEASSAHLNKHGAFTTAVDEAAEGAKLTYENDIQRVGEMPRKPLKDGTCKLITRKQLQYATLGSELGEEVFSNTPSFWITQLNSDQGDKHLNGTAKDFVKWLSDNFTYLGGYTPNVIMIAGAVFKSRPRKMTAATLDNIKDMYETKRPKGLRAAGKVKTQDVMHDVYNSL